MAGENMALLANKERGCTQNRLNIVEQKFLKQISKKPATKSGIIRFPHVFSVAAWLFHLNKLECWLFLKELQERGTIELIAGHGVRILVEVDGNGSE